jgi:hypothetical protein
MTPLFDEIIRSCGHTRCTRVQIAQCGGHSAAGRRTMCCGCPHVHNHGVQTILGIFAAFSHVWGCQLVGEDDTVPDFLLSPEVVQERQSVQMDDENRWTRLDVHPFLRFLVRVAA